MEAENIKYLEIIQFFIKPFSMGTHIHT